MSRVPQLVSCCYFFSLETGVKIIGFIEAIACGLTSLIGILYVIYKAVARDSFFEFSLIMFTDVSFIFQAFFGTYLLLGVYKNKLSYIKAWVIVQLAFILQSVQAIFLFLILVCMGHFHSELIEELIGLVVQIYFVLIVHSYYRQRRSGNFINEA